MTKIFVCARTPVKINPIASNMWFQIDIASFGNIISYFHYSNRRHKMILIKCATRWGYIIYWLAPGIMNHDHESTGNLNTTRKCCLVLSWAWINTFYNNGQYLCRLAHSTIVPKLHNQSQSSMSNHSLSMRYQKFFNLLSLKKLETLITTEL